MEDNKLLPRYGWSEMGMCECKNIQRARMLRYNNLSASALAKAKRSLSVLKLGMCGCERVSVEK